MAFALEDDDRASVGSSENDQDELMEDADEAEAEQDVDADGEGDEEDDNDGEDNEDEEHEADETQEQSTSRRGSQPNSAQIGLSRSDGGHGSGVYTNGSTDPSSQSQAAAKQTSTSPNNHNNHIETFIARRYHPQVRPEALTARLYDIVPTMAAPQSTSINALTATPDMRFWFTGGSDCYVRKYDGAATINGKTLLTVAQRHPFVDSVTKAGVLMSYWENEEPHPKNPNDEPVLSPVYSLAVHHDGLWLLSGLESGSINLQSVRHDEGKRIACLQGHTSAVSVLTLAQDEKSVLSGSWDKNIYDWDLNIGKVKRSFDGSGGQISAIEIRPASTLPVPEETGELELPNGTYSSNNAEKPLTNGIISNGVNGAVGGVSTDADGGEDAQGSPVDTDSLFGDANSLFGDNDTGAPSGGQFDQDDDEFGFNMNNQNQHADGDTTIVENEVTTTSDPTSSVAPAVQPPNNYNSLDESSGKQSPQENLTNGLPKIDDSTSSLSTVKAVPETQDAIATSDSTFLAASMDGTLRIWDRRQQKPVATIPTRTGVPPWCMGACWSPDGNYIYAGRRNGTVEEFSLHKGLKVSERTFKFPTGSGAVSAVRSMPNGRHLICASHDILRLYDLKEAQAFKHSAVPFLVVPGPPRAGVISSLYIDPTCKYMLSAAGNRGWEGSSTEVLLGYEIGTPN